MGYVVNPVSATLSVIDDITNTIIATMPLGGGSHNGVAYEPNNDEIYVTRMGSNSVLVISNLYGR